MTSATEVLRRLLDERGVEWQAPTSFDGTARYDTVAGGYWFHEYDGKITIHGLDPAQAIAATLGSCNCSDNCTNSERTVTCYDTGKSRIFHCSECGLGLDDVYIDDEEYYSFADFPRFCPWCGAKVVEPTTNDVDAEVDE